MPLPLLWIGGVAVGALALADARESRRNLQRERLLGRTELEHKGRAAVLHPSTWQTGGSTSVPKPGALMCCYVYGVIEHTGIYLGDGQIAELHGSGLIRAVSANRFLHGRTGSQIFVAADARHQCLAVEDAAKRGADALFQYRDYDLLGNNCHRFVWYCISGEDREVGGFSELNELVARFYGKALYWDEARWERRCFAPDA
ncbi:TMEM222 family protein [Shewanella sp. JM162201]|uniref:TMEM222 family protein n=1 Tax=Shewanella jiangmenensis TaxID=2837387 RepID=A0ABS5V9P4_9GAMM|nr:lecithin retinol acyltransferase family protein [Shewanella jiangmenensis]MBT1446486.1 TMEM222 family protein [Shewanella jiangmenensis]